MTPLRALVVDDEPLARATLRRLIDAAPTLVWDGEAADGVEALRRLAAHPPDLVFLDIHMPGLSGLEVARRLPPGTRLIFTTAYEAHALAAFELQAVDYLLKPFGRRRFEQAVARLAPAEAPLRFFARHRGRRHAVDAADVLLIRAADDYACLVTSTGTYLLDERMKTLAASLPATRFVRVHRSAIVNLAHITDVGPAGSGRYVLTLRDGTDVTTSRSGAARLRPFLG